GSVTALTYRTLHERQRPQAVDSSSSKNSPGMSSLFTSFALGSVTMSAMRGRAVSSNWRLSWVGTSWAKRPQKARYDPARRTPTTVVNSNIMRIRRVFAFIPAFPGGSRLHERYESASPIDFAQASCAND